MTYEELIQNTDFEEISSIAYENIKNLVFTEIKGNKGWAWIARAYQIVGSVAFLCVIISAIEPYIVENKSVFLVCTGLGFIFSFTFLIVLHELIHMFAYRWIGIRHLHFGMILRKFQFYILADREVMDYKQSKRVALAPALIVGFVSLICTIAFYNQSAFYFFLTIFSIHSLFCSGDFGLLCFFQNRPNMEILTFDVKEEGKTYFYGKTIKEPID
jgi:hypothetical protein